MPAKYEATVGGINVQDLLQDASMLLFFMQLLDNYDINWFISQAPDYVDVVAMRDAFNELKAKGYIPH